MDFLSIHNKRALKKEDKKYENLGYPEFLTKNEFAFLASDPRQIVSFAKHINSKDINTMFTIPNDFYFDMMKTAPIKKANPEIKSLFGAFSNNDNDTLIIKAITTMSKEDLKSISITGVENLIRKVNDKLFRYVVLDNKVEILMLYEDILYQIEYEVSNTKPFTEETIEIYKNIVKKVAMSVLKAENIELNKELNEKIFFYLACANKCYKNDYKTILADFIFSYYFVGKYSIYVLDELYKILKIAVYSEEKNENIMLKPSYKEMTKIIFEDLEKSYKK